jgi:hypothetical protein
MEEFLTIIGGCFMIFIVIFLSLFIYAAIGCWLWGLIMVPIFGLPALSYWQMFSLMWLLRMLFGRSSNYSSSKK